MSRTPSWAVCKVTDQGGFTITLDFVEEHQNMKDHFINDCEWTIEQYNEIKNYFWFTAKVSAYKGSIEAGVAYLGGCCHKSLKDVLGSDINSMLGGYMPQLIEEAIENANEALSTPIEL